MGKGEGDPCGDGGGGGGACMGTVQTGMMHAIVVRNFNFAFVGSSNCENPFPPPRAPLISLKRRTWSISTA